MKVVDVIFLVFWCLCDGHFSSKIRKPQTPHRHLGLFAVYVVGAQKIRLSRTKYSKAAGTHGQGRSPSRDIPTPASLICASTATNQRRPPVVGPPVVLALLGAPRLCPSPSTYFLDEHAMTRFSVSTNLIKS